MKAVAINEFGGADKLQLLDLPQPKPGPGEILIEIKAAGVNPVDWKIRQGLLQGRLPHEFPIVLGWDAAGIVAEVGQGVQHFAERDEVYAYCRKPLIKDGTYAEYVVVSENGAALKPNNISFEEAGVVPLSALTAFQSLFASAQLKAGETVLVHAAAGGVGTYAVQLASNAGALVLGTASLQNHAYLRELGVKEPIDYARADFRDIVRAKHPEGIDVVFDCVGGNVFQRSIDILKKGGRLVSIIEPEGVKQLKAGGLNAHYVFVEPSRAQLSLLTDMIEGGKLKIFISRSFSLEKAAEAHFLSETGHTCGKIVLII